MRIEDLLTIDHSAGGLEVQKPVPSPSLDLFGREHAEKIVGVSDCAPVHGGKRSNYPYLLRNLAITRPDQVWCADITYVPMERGKAYLCAVMDWRSRKVLGWALSNTMDVGLCMEALNRALESTGREPEIFNTDQGSQFTSAEWIGRLEGLGVKVSMDGKGRWMDNVFIERLWRSVKYECIYLHSHATLTELRRKLTTWMDRYNSWRPHDSHGNLTPSSIYDSLTAAA